MYLIYKHTNKINGKSYIGQTIGTIEWRARKNGYGYRQSPKFYNAIQKYGWDNFNHEILETCNTLDEANSKEQYWIEKYDSIKNGYNILPGGTIDNSELFKKIYQIDIHKNIIAEFKFALDANRHLFPTTPFWHAKEILKCCKGQRSNTEGYYFCFKDNYLNYDIQFSHNSFNVILQLDKNKNIINRFLTITEAANFTGISAQHIWSCCKNERKTAGGFFWCFELDYDNYVIQEPALWPEAGKVQQTNKVIAEFNSAQEASKATNINRGNISSCCRGEAKTAGGYIWQFKPKTEIFDSINENLWQILDYINN